MMTTKWTKDYTGFESVMDFVTDGHFEDALRAISPCGDYPGTVRITLEYIPECPVCGDTGRVDYNGATLDGPCPSCKRTV